MPTPSTGLRQIRIHRLRRLLLQPGQHMTVGVEREVDGRMPKAFGHDLRVDAGGEQQGRACMSQVVEAHLSQLRLPDYSLEPRRDAVGLHGVADLRRKDEVVVHVSASEQQAPLELARAVHREHARGLLRQRHTPPAAPRLGLEAYSAAKAGAAGLTRALARDLGRYDITANNVAIAATRTPAIAAMTQNEELAKRVLRGYIVRRFGEPNDVAAMITFLASNASGWITGQTYPVNGGFSVNL